MRKRRILINALSLTHGGGRSYVHNLLRELDRDSRGFVFTVLVASGQLSPAEAGRLEVASLRLPSPVAGARVPLRVFYEEVILPVRARRFDLLYCLADLVPALGGPPTVVALRNLNIYDHRFYDTLRLRVLEHLVRLGLRRARRVVFPSRAAVDLISRRIAIPEDRIAVIPHGISPDAFQPDVTPAGDGTPYLFLPASLERHKNIAVLIQSLAYLGDPRLDVWIAGSTETDPQCAGELRRVVERFRLGSRVRFLGPIPYREILRYYRGAAALVLPSLIETFGHPLLEAMLAGTPIIAADIPSFREIAGDIALYFPPEDPVRLARTVERVRREPEATRARVQRGRARAQEFSWKRSADRLCAVFDDALRAG